MSIKGLETDKSTEIFRGNRKISWMSIFLWILAILFEQESTHRLQGMIYIRVMYAR